MVVDQVQRPRSRFARAFGLGPGLPSHDEFDNKELHEVIASLGRPFATAHIGLRHVIAYWTFGRHWVEIIFDEHNRVERISIS
jgi:hypothetical protein